MFTRREIQLLRACLGIAGQSGHITSSHGGTGSLNPEDIQRLRVVFNEIGEADVVSAHDLSILSSCTILFASMSMRYLLNEKPLSEFGREAFNDLQRKLLRLQSRNPALAIPV